MVLISSGWNMGTKQATGKEMSSTKDEGHIWAIQEYSLFITNIVNIKHNFSNTYIRARIIFHINAKNLLLKIPIESLAAFFHVILVHIMTLLLK